MFNTLDIAALGVFAGQVAKHTKQLCTDGCSVQIKLREAFYPLVPQNSKAKVSKLENAIGVSVDVVWLDIQMQHTICVQKAEALHRIMRSLHTAVLSCMQLLR